MQTHTDRERFKAFTSVMLRHVPHSYFPSNELLTKLSARATPYFRNATNPILDRRFATAFAVDGFFVVEGALREVEAELKALSDFHRLEFASWEATSIGQRARNKVYEEVPPLGPRLRSCEPLLYHGSMDCTVPISLDNQKIRVDVFVAMLWLRSHAGPIDKTYMYPSGSKCVLTKPGPRSQMFHAEKFPPPQDTLLDDAPFTATFTERDAAQLYVRPGSHRDPTRTDHKLVTIPPYSVMFYCEWLVRATAPWNGEGINLRHYLYFNTEKFVRPIQKSFIAVGPPPRQAQTPRTESEGETLAT